MNVSEFLAMGGYGAYVWGSFGITFAVLLANVLIARQQRRRVEREVNTIRSQHVKT